MRALATVLVLVLVLAAISAFPALAGDDVRFEDHFVDATMRVDVVHVGNADEELITLDRVYRQGTWAGSLTHLVDRFGHGDYAVKVTEPGSDVVLFERTYSSYFGEYQTTGPATQGTRRAYFESVLVPFPKHPVRLSFEARRRDGTVATISSFDVDPGDVMVNTEAVDQGITVVEVASAGDPHTTLDVAFVGEGYTAAETATFEADLRRFATLLLEQEPYASLKDHISIRGVLRPSQDSGCDEPTHGGYRRTAVGTSFNSLGSPRYLLTEDNRALRDIAAAVPYDTLIIMVNHSRYGGGGIFNTYCTFTAHNQWSDYLLLHELGHSLSGLADEYYTSSVAYGEFYPRGVEPREPNITALLDPATLKWRDLVAEGTPLPTPWNKTEYDAMDLAYQEKRRELNQAIAEATRSGASEEEIDRRIATEDQHSKAHSDAIAAFLAACPEAGTVGAYEGAGYSSEGLYRPMLDCLMFSKRVQPLCAVCQRAAAEVIRTYTE